MEELSISFLSDNCDKNSLKGYIYEWHCLNHLLTRYKSINFVKTKYNITDRNTYNYFSYTDFGNVIYTFNGALFCEFDVLGVKEKTIYLWEITRRKAKFIRNKIYRKRNLLQILFPQYEIKIFFVIPKENKGYRKYNRLIVSEPNYNDYYSSGKFVFTELINSCIPLNDFVKYCDNNSLIAEIIFLSINYYRNKSNKRKIYHYDLANRLYDIDNIFNDEFDSFNFITNKSEKIQFLNNQYYIKNIELNIIDKHIIEEIKKCIPLGNYAY